MKEDIAFYDLADELDKLIQLDAPAPDQVETLGRLVADEALERYFFRHLASTANAAWFEPLRRLGYFDAPPKPMTVKETISFPPWPAVWYLVAIAPKLPEAVVEVAVKIRTENTFVFLDFVRAARAMPPVIAVTMVPLVVQWADKGMMVGEDVISLADLLAKGNQLESALTLVKLLLSRTARDEIYRIQLFVDRELDTFLGLSPMDVLNIVRQRLEAILDSEGTDSSTDSSYWRVAIEPSDQNWDMGESKGLLVNTALRALSRIIESSPDKGKLVVGEYLEHRYSIFRRLAIHCIRLNATRWPDLVQKLFKDERYLDDEKAGYQVYHEYWMLTHDAFGTLPKSIQNSFIEHLLEKLPPEKGDAEAGYKRSWVLRRLWALRDYLHSDELRSVLAGLVNQLGEPAHPSFLSYTTSGFVKDASPRTAEDLASMSTEEMLGEIRKKLPAEAFGEPDQRGLAEALQAAVVEAPGHFAAIAPQLFGPDIPPIYAYYALCGFRDAWKEKVFAWESVLELCGRVSQTHEESNGSTPLDLSPHYWAATYASARGAVADLLETGVTNDEKAIPSELLPKVRDILLVLADDPNPSPEYEQKRIADKLPYGVLTVALNVTRAKTVAALLEYALHLARVRSEEWLSPVHSRMEVEVKNKFTQKLDSHVEPSLAVRSLFGKFLPNFHYLDSAWLTANLERIFPRSPEMADWWESAWDGYMFRGDFFGPLYTELLRPHYLHALAQIALGKQGRAGSEASCARLAQHLAILYWQGVETLQDASAVTIFFDSAPDNLRAKFITGLTVSLRQIKPDASTVEWSRVKTLWETRYTKIMASTESTEQGEQPIECVEELRTYVGWVPYIPGDFENLYPMIRGAALAAGEGDLTQLIEFFASEATKHAPFAVSLLDDLLRQVNRGPWFLMHTVSYIGTILEAAMRSKDGQAKACAIRVINAFGRRGEERFRDLLSLG